MMKDREITEQKILDAVGSMIMADGFESLGINAVAQKAGVKDWKKVCYYTARKSFVQHGFDLGISLEVLEYCIGQSMKSDRPIYNYLKVMRKHADTAIRQIIDSLNEKETGDPHGQPETINSK